MFEKLKQLKGPAFDSLLLAIIQIVTYATNIITTKVLSISLSLKEYGTYSTVNTVITIAAAITLFGLGDSMNYFFNRDLGKNTENREREEYVNTIFFVQFVIGIFVGILLIISSKWISLYYNNILVQSLIIIVCLKPWISNATHLYQVLFVSSGKAKLIAIRNLVVSIVKIILIIISVRIFKSLEAIFVCLVLLDVLQLVFFKEIFGKIRFKTHFLHYNKKLIRSVINYALPMGIYFVTTTLMREIDKLVIGRMGSTEDLAIYSNCAKTLPLNIIVTAFATVLVPYIMKSVSNHDYKQTEVIMKKYLTIGYMTVWMFSGALLICAPEAIRFFYSNDYLIGLPLFIIYIFDGMVQFASVHLVIAADGKANFLMKLSLVLLGVNAVLSVALYKLFSLLNVAIVGPALATLMISIIYIYVLVVKSADILEIKVSEFLPIINMFKYAGILFFVGIIFFVIRNLIFKCGIPWIICMFLVCGGYCGIVCIIYIKKFKTLFNDINNIKNNIPMS